MPSQQHFSVLGLEEVQDAHIYCCPDGWQQHSDEKGSGHIPVSAENRGWGGGGGDGEGGSSDTTEKECSPIR